MSSEPKPTLTLSIWAKLALVIASALWVGLSIRWLAPRTPAELSSAILLASEQVSAASNLLARAAAARPTAALIAENPAPAPDGSTQSSSGAAIDVMPQAVLEIEALVKDGRIGEARGRAREYYETHPRGPAEKHIEQLTGLRPHVNGP